MQRRLLALGLLVLFGQAACRSADGPTLPDLSHSQAPLAARFDADLGHPRLILSVSPT